METGFSIFAFHFMKRSMFFVFFVQKYFLWKFFQNYHKSFLQQKVDDFFDINKKWFFDPNEVDEKGGGGGQKVPKNVGPVAGKNDLLGKRGSGVHDFPTQVFPLLGGFTRKPKQKRGFFDHQNPFSNFSRKGSKNDVFLDPFLIKNFRCFFINLTKICKNYVF